MASLRRNRTMPTDGAIAKFLYAILKQLDLKSIDWQLVADGLDITNGHAARMRFSRFKQQMEGLPAAPRKPRPTVPRQRKAKPDKPLAPEKKAKEEQQGVVKAESGDGGEPMYGVEPTIKPELGIKAEPVVKEEPEDIYEGTRSPAGSVDARKLHQMTLEPALVREQDYATAEPLSVEVRQTTSELLTVKPEPIVKLEPLWED